MTDRELQNISVKALAYLGDSVLEIKVREMLVLSGISESGKLNQASLDYVRAGKQAEAMKKILPHLDEDEADIFRRGRNIGHGNIPKSASAAEYRSATGMEVLMGWLHLSHREERIDELFRIGYLENN